MLCSARLLGHGLRVAQRGGLAAQQLATTSARRDLHSALPLLGTLAAQGAAETSTTAMVAVPLVGPAAVSFLQVSPPIAGQVLFFSPMAAMKQFRADGTTGAVSVMPYAAMAANGLAWTTYGALGSDLTIMLPNASGCVFGLYYCYQFYQYRGGLQLELEPTASDIHAEMHGRIPTPQLPTPS